MFKLKTPAYKNLTDEKLAFAVMNGDSKAFSELYDRYNERLLYYFFRMLGNDQELAQDFLQEVFYKVIDKTHLFNPDKRFSTWIFSIAHNMCKNEYRSRQVRSIIESVENTDVFLDSAEETIPKAVNIDQVFDCLAQFDETQQTAFLLKYREGLSIDEIAEVLNLPKGTVKSRLFYTRKKIQQQLQSTTHF